MYSVTIKNGSIEIPIYEDGQSYTAQKIADASIVDAVNSISSFSFTIYPNNVGFDLLNPYKTIVKVFNTKTNKYDFVGRVLQVDPKMDSSGLVYKNVVCEDRFAYLCDTIQPYTAERQYEGDDSRNGLQEFIDLLLENHNAQVEDEKKIYRGQVTVTTFESSEGVYKGLNYENTMDCIVNKLLNVFGGEMRVRETNGTLYLDYADKLGTTRSTTIELSKNMKSASQSIDATEIVTRLIPLGAKLKEQHTDEDGNVTEVETEEKLTVSSVNNGEIFVVDETAESLFGIVYGVHEWEEVTDAGNLLKKAREWLSQNNTLKESHVIDAIDLSLIDLDIDSFKVYDSYPVRNHLIGLDSVLEIVRKTTNILNPEASSFDMGETSKLLSDALIGSGSTAQNALQSINRTETNTKNEINSVYTFVTTSTALLQVNESNIAASVEKVQKSTSDLESFSQTVRNILQMEADGTTMLFQTINEAISEVEGNSETRYSTILKYIRFDNGNIILGEVNNPVVLTIENDRIVFKQNGVVVAYFSDNKLHVKDGQFENSLQIGNFKIEPRTNGNVTCKMISQQM